ncbi:NnrU family protein [Rhodoferax sp. PAMC 29310]|uniref:NnrU family protein n=1 Tax=Rhodoferax sp. PAMC 29310 TaxID=2822760 RepID=UPI001B341220|nr:NnrU family protein [Rhodoferax sp. PAMC 29310]
MSYLLLGLLIFLGIHSVRIVGDDWRTRTRERMGPLVWKAIYSLLSVLGFALIVWGFGRVRQMPTQLWSPPFSLRHVAAAINLGAFVLLAAAYVPGNSIKARTHHPMVQGVVMWAVAHLMANGNLGQILLFGSFLAWGALDWIASTRRDQRQGIHYPSGTAGATAVTVALGVGAWVIFTLWLHGLLIGVRPLG